MSYAAVICRLFLGYALVWILSAVAAGQETAAPGNAEDQVRVLAEYQFDPRVPCVSIPVRIGSAEFTFLVVTSATHTVYDTTFQKFANQREDRAAEAGTCLPPAADHSPQATFGEHSLPPMKSTNYLDLSGLREQLELDLRGIVGMDFLNLYVVQFDFDESRFRILSAVPDDAGQPFEYPVNPDDIRPRIPAHAGPLPEQLFLVSTASDSAAIVPERFNALKRRQVISKIQPILVGTFREKVAASRSGVISRFLCAGSEHRDIQVYESDTDAVGLKFLSRYKVTFDFPNRRIYLKPGRRFAAADRRDQSGLRLFRHQGKLEIDYVTPFSPAVSVGLQPGDRITSINGRDVEKWRLFEVRSLLEKCGTTVDLDINREGTPRKVSLVLPPE